MKLRRIFTIFVLLVAAGAVVAQFERRNRGWYDPNDVTIYDRNGVPDWDVAPHMPHDVFTFVRIKYHNEYGRSRWRTDFPDSDLNFSYRLQELTSMEVDPDGKVLELTDPELFDYPFVYMIEPGDLWLAPDEVVALRKYLLNGGFLMVDDFWGFHEWDGFYCELKKVFPDREPEELPLEHPIFHCVFELTEKPQIPAINEALRGRDEGVTWEWRKPGSRDAQYKGVFDDEGRMMAIICFNTDLGDGWEQEGVDPWYFKEFSEKKAYPMGINIVFYALTH
ncbi:MAG: DUF4159 domain-containing protein [Verrucomicrobiota bacterium]